jgi:hypothetical protein
MYYIVYILILSKRNELLLMLIVPLSPTTVLVIAFCCDRSDTVIVPFDWFTILIRINQRLESKGHLRKIYIHSKKRIL